MAYQSMDFPQLFAIAQQMREGRAREAEAAQQRQLMSIKIEEAQREQERQRLLPEARAAWALRGDIAMLEQLAPEEALKIRQAKADEEAKALAATESRQKIAKSAYEMERERLLRGSGEILRILPTIKSNPKAYALVEPRLRSMVESGQIALPFALPTPDEVGFLRPEDFSQIEMNARGMTRALEKPEVSNLGREVAEGMGLTLTEAVQNPKWQAEVFKRGDAARKPAQTTINLDTGQGLSKPNVDKQQAALMDDMETLNKIRMVRSEFEPEYFGLRGKAKAAGLRFADWIGLAGPEQQSWLAKREALQGTLTELWMKYKSDITGAAASDREMKIIADAALDPNLPPAELGARIARFTRALEARIDARGIILNEGIPTTPQQRKAFAEKLANTVAQTEKQSAQDRYKELRSNGATSAEAQMQLYEEGYIRNPPKSGGR